METFLPILLLVLKRSSKLKIYNFVVSLNFYKKNWGKVFDSALAISLNSKVFYELPEFNRAVNVSLHLEETSSIHAIFYTEGSETIDWLVQNIASECNVMRQKRKDMILNDQTKN